MISMFSLKYLWGRGSKNCEWIGLFCLNFDTEFYLLIFVNW